MKFRIGVKHQTGPAWEEEFDEDIVEDEASAKAWAKRTIKHFNDTCRKDEKHRYFTGRVELLGEGTKKHKWSKQNAFTKADHHGAFDLLECVACGAKARRYGVNHIKLQQPYTTKRYQTCPGERAPV